jgi:hypothetical protein
VLRDVQELDTAETAACLGISAETVRVLRPDRHGGAGAAAAQRMERQVVGQAA